MDPMLFDALSEKRCAVRTSSVLTIYVCGVTVYDHCHVGHGRIKVVFDVWRRWMAHVGQEVCYVSNITDIDDKIIAKAESLGETWDCVAARYIDSMHEDDRVLGVLPADKEPRATEYLPEMIDLVASLMEKKAAYIGESGDVCLDVGCVLGYGQLSKQNIQQLRERSGILGQTSDKRDTVDFVLWKQAKPGEPSWPSPWGLGRPGWHLECSAMAKSCLGHPICWHGGGVDLKFPHHENECAQSETAFGAPFSKHWMHVGLIDRDGMKMSKSLGNTVVLKEALQEYGANVLRMFYLKTHYRKPLSWTDSALEEASARWSRYHRVCQFSGNTGAIDGGLWEQWLDALADDFNTPKAMAMMDQWAKLASESQEGQKRYVPLLYQALLIFGCQIESLDVDEVWILQQIEKRESSRQNKDYATSDLIRQLLLSKGIVLEDGADGVQWYFK